MRNFDLMKKLLLFLTALIAIRTNSIAQQHNKGKLYFYWGWNSDRFSKSDIKFRGNDYGFTLKSVSAADRQSKVSITYIDPANMTIPQYNFRLGYFIDDHWNISFGIDHMKYVMKQDQSVAINGQIHTGREFDGIYNNAPIKLTPQFLMFEHTDGLNYVNIELRRNEHIYHVPFSSKKARGMDINVLAGLGGGILYPRTNATLMGQERNDVFHLSGYGISAVAGINFTFFNNFFIQGELKGGYINMPDIRTTKDNTDKASQHFLFYQKNVVFGATIPLFKPKYDHKS